MAITRNVVVQTSDPYYKTMLKAYDTFLGQCPSCASLAKGDVAQQEWFWASACHWVQDQGDCNPRFTAALTNTFLEPTRSDQAFIISSTLPGGYSEGALVNPATCGGMSFSASTKVLLASGETAPISRLRPGDKVLATSTKTGKTQPETVTAVLLHHDTNLYDLTVKASGGTEVIHTTSNHLFWDPYLDQWVPANKFADGEHLKTPDGTTATAGGGSTPNVNDGWMWDLTVPGNNDHDFYVVAQPTGGSTQRVVAGATRVLVHNVSAPCGSADGGMYGKLQPAGLGKQINHIPADWSTGDSITQYSGPAIRMDTADHAQLYTTGSSQAARAWRLWQQELISQGSIDGAMQMDINDIRARFGAKYDSAITQMINSLPGNAQYQALRTMPLTGDVTPGLPWSSADVAP